MYKILILTFSLLVFSGCSTKFGEAVYSENLGTIVESRCINSIYSTDSAAVTYVKTDKQIEFIIKACPKVSIGTAVHASRYKDGKCWLYLDQKSFYCGEDHTYGGGL